ncbi:hypothetical protein BDN67DRAFT_973364 [Paxillus ammoniavirescens]|nr:hypothetical protein BDN67DRAFT_973364 [Paxillus ammoniavirescens]
MFSFTFGQSGVMTRSSWQVLAAFSPWRSTGRAFIRTCSRLPGHEIGNRHHLNISMRGLSILLSMHTDSAGRSARNANGALHLVWKTRVLCTKLPPQRFALLGLSTLIRNCMPIHSPSLRSTNAFDTTFQRLVWPIHCDLQRRRELGQPLFSRRSISLLHNAIQEKIS